MEAKGRMNFIDRLLGWRVEERDSTTLYGPELSAPCSTGEVPSMHRQVDEHHDLANFLDRGRRYFVHASPLTGA